MITLLMIGAWVFALLLGPLALALGTWCYSATRRYGYVKVRFISVAVWLICASAVIYYDIAVVAPLVPDWPDLFYILATGITNVIFLGFAKTRSQTGD